METSGLNPEIIICRIALLPIELYFYTSFVVFMPISDVPRLDEDAMNRV